MMVQPGLHNFFLIWFGQLVSSIGSRLSTFALGIWVLKSTGSTTQFALIFVAMAVPALLVLPLAGALVDRWDRRRIMLACDLASATSLFTLALLLKNGQLAIWHLYVGVGISSVASSFHSPAYSASIPLLASKEQLVRINGIVQSGNAVAQIIGPLLSGILVSVIDLHGVLMIDAASFLVAMVALAFARIPRPTGEASEDSDNSDKKIWHDALTGWRYVRERSSLLTLLIFFGINNFMMGIAGTLIMPLVLSFATPAMLGMQYSIASAGLLLGGLAMVAYGKSQHRVRIILVLSFIDGISLMLHGVSPTFMLVAGAGFVLFLSIPIVGASNDSIWQSKVPPGLQGRCFAIQRVLTEAAMPFGYVLAGPLAEHVFEPMLKTGGILAPTVGALIGVGPGRGIGLMFILLGLLLSIVALVAASIPAFRKLEALPDAINEVKTVPAN